MTAGGTLHPVLDSAGPATHIERLWWLVFWIAVVVFVLVLAAPLPLVCAGVRFVDGVQEKPKHATAEDRPSSLEQTVDARRFEDRAATV